MDGNSGLQFPKKESHKIPNWGSGPRVPEKGPLKISKYGKIDGSIASELTKEQRAKLGIKTKPSIEVGKSTKLYSSLYSEADILDELLEKAFCDGYEYAQGEFGRTGLTKEQAKKFFTPSGNKKSNKEIKRTLDLINGNDMMCSEPRVPIAKLVKRGMKAPQIEVENRINLGRIDKHDPTYSPYPKTIMERYRDHKNRV